MLFELPDLDDETLVELYDTIYEALDAIEVTLNVLSANPASDDTLNDLFRNLHSVKGNFRVCIMPPFSDYIHGIEEIYSRIREGSSEFDPVIAEVTLGSMDKLRASMELLIQVGTIDTQEMLVVTKGLNAIANADSEHRQMQSTELLRFISGAEGDLLPVAVELEETQIEERSTISTAGLEDDMKYFQTLSALLDMRLPSWSGRTTRLLDTTTAVLPHLPYELDQKQLFTAIYIHDMGMAFISNDILLASSKISSDQYKMITRHPHIGYQLLQRLGRWEQAAEIVLQHHERIDGKGYPYGLTGDQICNGAKFMAVADGFISLTSGRADRSKRRTVLRALMEINNHAGTQFDEDTVVAFTKMATEHYSSH